MPPVNGTGEPARDANGLKAVEARSLRSSMTGDADDELDELDGGEVLSLVPSVPVAGRDGATLAAVLVPDCGEPGCFPEPGVN